MCAIAEKALLLIQKLDPGGKNGRNKTTMQERFIIYTVKI